MAMSAGDAPKGSPGGQGRPTAADAFDTLFGSAPLAAPAAPAPAPAPAAPPDCGEAPAKRPRLSAPLAHPPELHAGACLEKGRRQRMEDAMCCHLPLPGCPADRALFVVCDGHGGSQIAERATELLPKAVAARCADGSLARDPEGALAAAFQEVDRQIFGEGDWGNVGSVCVLGLFDGPALWVANLGDCRAVVSEGGQPLQLSRDHRAGADEQEDDRVRAAGGEVRNTVHDGKLAGGRMTVPGVAAMTQVTRAFGDYSLKRGKQVLAEGAALPMLNTPEVRRMALTEATQFLVLACDGVWDVLSNERAVAVCRAVRHRGPQVMARALCKQALDAGSTDNCTALVVDISAHHKGDPAAAAAAGAGGGVRLLSAAHEERGPRRTLDPTTAQRVELDCRQFTVGDLPREVAALLGDAAPGNEYLPGSSTGALRKALQGFHALLPHLSEQFLSRSTQRAATPRMSLFGLCDGHCGLRENAAAGTAGRESPAAAFAAKWLPVFVCFELFSLLLAPDGSLTPAALAGGAHCFSGVKSAQVKARLAAAVEAVDEAFLSATEADGKADGCSVVVALVVGDTLYVASVGDCKAVLWKQGKDGALREHLLSGKEHRTRRREEAERLKKAGALLQRGLVFGQTDLTRAVGCRRLRRPAADVDARPIGWEDPPEALHSREERLRRHTRQGDGSPCLSAAPELFAYALSEGADCFLLLGTAGLWEGTPVRAACEYLHARLSAQGAGRDFADLDTLAERGRAAVGEGSTLPPYGPPSAANLPRACRDLCREAAAKRPGHNPSAAAVVVCCGSYGSAR